MPARWMCSLPSASTYSAPSIRPSARCSRRRYAGARDQLDAVALVDRPVGAVDRGLGAVGTAPEAGGAQHAGVERAVLLGGDRVGPGPPVPAQLVVRLGHPAAHRRQRHGGHRRALAGREGGVVGQARNPPVPLDPHVVGLELLVAERPVVAHPVQRLHSEVRRQVALPVRGEHHGAAADAVPHEGGDVRLRVVDGIVPGPVADVWVPGPMHPGGELVVGVRRARPLVVRPAALLEADHAHSRLGQALGGDGAGGAGADDQDVGVGH